MHSAARISAPSPHRPLFVAGALNPPMVCPPSINNSQEGRFLFKSAIAEHMQDIAWQPVHPSTRKASSSNTMTVLKPLRKADSAIERWDLWLPRRPQGSTKPAFANLPGRKGTCSRLPSAVVHENVYTIAELWSFADRHLLPGIQESL